MEWWALIKLLSLGYLLGVITMTLATLLWSLLRSRLSAGLRGDVGFGIITGALLLNSALAVLIWLGVVGGRIRMTTSYFHPLMSGAWGMTITITGASLLLISLCLAWLNWRRGFPPQSEQPVPSGNQNDEVSVVESDRTPTVSLVGAWRSELWVNPVFWQSLSSRQQSLALHHERVHQLRRDNLRQLALKFIGGLYAALPWARCWTAWYELDSELAVDDRCRTELPEDEYSGLVAQAAKQALTWQPAAAASHLSQAQLRSRLDLLRTPRRTGSVISAAALGYLAVIISVAPASVLLLHPVSRCLCACYLGY